MTDVLTPQQRSYNMSQIKSRDTKPEIRLRRLLFKRGLRGYRVNYRLPGKPDIVFVKKRLAIFMDGCFWHKCSKCFVEPETRKDFWLKKIKSNVKRDKRVNSQLKKGGWRVLRFWGHEIRNKPESVVTKIRKALG